MGELGDTRDEEEATLTIVGMMSGTSHDAVDAAVGSFSLVGDTVTLAPRGEHSVSIPESLRARIVACLPPQATTIEEVCRLDTELGQLFGEVARDAIAAHAGGRADLVASHGQTVFHWVQGDRARGTLQLAAPAWIAAATGTAVVSDLRSADIARGGHGAPLASMLDALLLFADDDTPRGSLNLGGIANITVRDPDGTIVAYDLGPANALIDAAVTRVSGGRYQMDVDGALAARGQVDADALAQLLDEPYYRLDAPKSTGKELFGEDYVRRRLGDHGPDGENLVATLTELTARLVADACTTHELSELIVAGGGTRNPTLMSRIAALARPTRIRDFAVFGLPAQAKEAYLFALLGFLTARGLPGTIPSATGARAASILGAITPGDGPLTLPPPARTDARRLRIAAAA